MGGKESGSTPPLHRSLISKFSLKIAEKIAGGFYILSTLINFMTPLTLICDPPFCCKVQRGGRGYPNCCQDLLRGPERRGGVPQLLSGPSPNCWQDLLRGIRGGYPLRPIAGRCCCGGPGGGTPSQSGVTGVIIFAKFCKFCVSSETTTGGIDASRVGSA